MKRKLVNLVICLFSLTIAIGQNNSADKLLNKAIYQEEVNGDLEKAIEIYEMIAKEYPNERTVVAKAMYRNAFAHEKLGIITAKELYQKIISSYADQTEIVSLSKKRLKSLKGIAVNNKKSLSIDKLYAFEDGLYGKLSYDGKYLTHTNWGNANLYYIDISTDKRYPVTTDGAWKNPVKYVDYSIWSPKADRIAYSFYDEQLGFSLKIWDRATKKTKTVLKASEKEFVYAMDWSKDGQKIVTFSGSRKSQRYGLLDLNTSEHKTFEGFPYENHSFRGDAPSISPDGKYILYSVMGPEGNKDILSASTETGKTKTLLGHVANEGSVIWGNSGKYFMYVSDRSGSPVLYRHKFVKGGAVGEPEIIYEGVTKSFVPQLSNDIGLIFSNSTGFSDLYVADVNFDYGTLKNTKVFKEQANSIRRPSWSNSGGKIAYFKGKSARKMSQLVVKELVTGKESIIDLPRGIEIRNQKSVWAPDDKSIAIVAEKQNIILVDIENKNVDVMEGIGYYLEFGSENNIISSKIRQSKLFQTDLMTKKQTTLYEGEQGWVFENLKMNHQKNELYFYERKEEDRKRLGKYDLKTGKYEMLLELPKDLAFHSMGIIVLPNLNDHVIVGVISPKEGYKFDEIEFYKINLKTKEKEKYGTIQTDFKNIGQIDFSEKLNKIVYKKAKKVDNIWLLHL